MSEPRLDDRKVSPFADRSRRGSDPIVRTRLNEPKVSTLHAGVTPGLAAMPAAKDSRKAREPELGFLGRSPSEGVVKGRADMSALLAANDKRGALAADDLRKSLAEDREAATPRLDVPQPEKAAPVRAEESDTAARNTAAKPSESVRTHIDDGAPNTLHIGAAIRVEDGRITNCGTMVVDGRMEADLDGGQLLEITKNGIYSGSAKVECAQINGQFDGELTVTGRLMISATGRVSGKIRYARIEVEPGGVILGDLGSLPQG